MRGKSNFVKMCTLKIFVFSQKVLFLIIFGKNLTDACIGYFFLTDAFAPIASAWIRPCKTFKLVVIGFKLYRYTSTTSTTTNRPIMYTVACHDLCLWHGIPKLQHYEWSKLHYYICTSRHYCYLTSDILSPNNQTNREFQYLMELCFN